MKRLKDSVISPVLLLFNLFPKKRLKSSEFYYSVDDLLIYEEVQKFDLVNKSVLMGFVKQWAKLNFLNSEEVLLLKSENQLVFKYITNSFYYELNEGVVRLNWLIRFEVLITESYDVVLRFYDAGSVDDGEHFKDCFLLNGESKEGVIEGLNSVRSSCELTSMELKNFILSEFNNES